MEFIDFNPENKLILSNQNKKAKLVDRDWAVEFIFFKIHKKKFFYIQKNKQLLTNRVLTKNSGVHEFVVKMCVTNFQAVGFGVKNKQFNFFL